MDPTTLTASALAALVRSRQLSAEEATRATLARIDRLNPGLNAIVQRRDDDALAEARALDAKLAKGEDPGPFAGVPITVNSSRMASVVGSLGSGTSMAWPLSTWQ